MQKIAVITVLMVLAACAQKPSIDYDASRDFMTLKSYAWLEKSPSAEAFPILNNALNDQRVRDSVDNVLNGQNRQKVAVAKADFLVTYRLVMRDKINSNSTGMGFGMFGGMGGLGIGGSVAVTQYQETELFIDMLDPKTSALIWRGSLKYPTRSNATPEERTDEIREKITRILLTFPPQ